MISRSSGDRGELKSEAMTFPFFLLTLMITIRGTSENNAHYSARERRNWMPNVLLRPAGPSDPGQMPVFRLSGIHCQRNESVPVVRTVKFGSRSRDDSSVPHTRLCLSIYIRENSIEYNQPTLQPAQANTVSATCLCCGHSPTALTVRDHITTIHFDDMIMDGIRNDTRPCNPLQTFCCGGRGEEVRLESRFCGEMCYRGRSIGAENCGLLNSCCCCVPCVPVGCPVCLCPCAARVSRPCAISQGNHTNMGLENNLRRGRENGNSHHQGSQRRCADPDGGYGEIITMSFNY